MIFLRLAGAGRMVSLVVVLVVEVFSSKVFWPAGQVVAACVAFEAWHWVRVKALEGLYAFFASVYALAAAGLA